jgi:hypothetical protein
MNHPTASVLASPAAPDPRPAYLDMRHGGNTARTRALFALILAVGTFLSTAMYFAYFQPDLAWASVASRLVLPAVITASVWWSCTALADARGASDREHYAAYVAASIVSATLICIIFYLAQLDIFEPRKAARPPLLSQWVQILGSTLLQTTLFTVAYRYRVLALASAARWQGLRLDRALLARKAMEARLQAMQARVDPHFLAATLADIERSCAADLGRADRVLEGLINYLHRALPSAAIDSATLATEIGLANAYFDLVRLHMSEPLNVAIESSNAAREARMPPLLLVPMMEHVVGSMRSRRFHTVVVACAVEGDRLRLTFTGTVPQANRPGSSGDGLLPVRERLAALYGHEASLVVVSDAPERLQTILEIPYERSDRSDR